MARKTYDVVFGLGAACACTECLRRAHLQFSSFPFDWIAEASLLVRTDILVGARDDELRFDQLKFVRSNAIIQKDIYRDKATGITFPHDFPMGIPLAESLPAIVEKYARRFKRLRALLAHGKRALAVYITIPKRVPPTNEELLQCRQRLMARFPDTTFDLLALRCGPNPQPLCEQPTDGITVVTFDYVNYDDTTRDNPFNRDRIIAFLEALELKVHDYRSADERRRYRVRERTAEYKRFGAQNAFTYKWNLIQYKIFKHLHKRLHAKGLV